MIDNELKIKAQNWINNNLFENTNYNIIGIYSGRFQPFHINHYIAWKWFSKKFPNSYIVTSNSIGPKSPFNFSEKKKIITTMFDISSSKIIHSQNVYKPEKILSNMDPNKTVAVFALGKKDSDRLKSKYLIPYKSGTKLEPISKRSYYIILPEPTILYRNKPIYGTTVREIFSGTNEDLKKKLFLTIYKKFNKGIFNLLDKKITMNESITKFLTQSLNEASKNGANDVDDGPGSWYQNLDSYKGDTKRKSKIWGYEILQYLIDTMDDIDDPREYPNGPVNSISFGPAGVGNHMATVSNQINLSGLLANKKWKRHIENIIDKLGYSYLKWDDPNLFIKESKLLNEGGAGGHLRHPFDDNELTFQDLKNMIDLGLQGKLDMVKEKTDGQNIFITVTDRGVVAARNKSHLKNFGKEAMDLNGVKQMFSGRGEIEKAFVYAMNDLTAALPTSLKKELKNGRYWINLEIMFPPTKNVIPYGFNLLAFHNITEVDKDGNTIGLIKTWYSDLQKIVSKLNKNVQTTFNIDYNKIIKLSKVKDFSKKKSYFLSKLNKLKNEYKLGWNDRLIDYHLAKWQSIINDAEKKFKYSLSSKARNLLIQRWVYGDKSTSITKFKDYIENEKMLEWVKTFDKQSYAAQLKQNLEPLEMLVLEWGVEIINNMKEFLAPNPDDMYKELQKDIDTTLKQLKSSSDVTDIEKVNNLINKINTLGGMESILPTEGITFMYKDNLYKATGAFAPLNQLMGILKFKR